MHSTKFVRNKKKKNNFDNLDRPDTESPTADIPRLMRVRQSKFTKNVRQSKLYVKIVILCTNQMVDNPEIHNNNKLSTQETILKSSNHLIDTNSRFQQNFILLTQFRSNQFGCRF